MSTEPLKRRVDRDRHHRRERRGLRRRGRWRRCSSAAATSSWSISDYGRRLLRDELGDAAAVDKLLDYLADEVRRGGARGHATRSTATGISAPRIASGSQGCEAMVVVPCSMKTLAGIAHGLSRNLVERAADVMLKERRPLIIVPRETPMSLPQLRNMVLCAEAGAMILPAMPAFYQMPKTLDDLADFMAGKILVALGFDHELYPSWQGMTAPVRIDAGSTHDFACRRQDPVPHRRDVRRDRAALRPAESRAQRRARSALARRVRSTRSRYRAERACSTSAPARRIWRLRRCAGSPGASVVGVDFAGAMLRLGLAKMRTARLGTRIRLVAAMLRAIPVGTASCDAATIAFGIRNVAEPERALAEIARVLRPGGRLAILEFGQPRIPGLRTLYAWYFRYMLPLVGRMISKHQSAYSYLPASVGTFPPPAGVLRTSLPQDFREFAPSL